ncbi:SurA N-terminal domain-containing protein [Patescibacteria group bacterium]|nr:SurA N-terminal domain-containing protein [Patescibacteria group bacterium]MBU4098885.1 SurA N-terminal domain-containing protein [Patescibacteria group bacterium]
MVRKIKTVKKISKSSIEPKAKVQKMEELPKTAGNEVGTKIGGMSIKVHRLTLIIAVMILIVGCFLFFGRGLIVAAVINGQPISRLALIQEAEKQAGKQTLSALIRNILIEQEANKQKVVVNEKQINDQIKSIENNLSKQGQDIDQMLSMERMTRADLRKVIRLDLLVTKMVEKNIKISEKDVNDYIEKNKEMLPKDQSENELKKTVTERLKQQQLSEKAQAWLADLEKKAKIVKFVNY